MTKITFIGAGSTIFCKNILGDVLCTPELQDSEIALYDINPQRLKESEMMLTTLNHNINHKLQFNHNHKFKKVIIII